VKAMMDTIHKVRLSLRSNKPRWLLASFIGVVLLIPILIGDEYWLNVATEIAIMSIFALSFNLLFGYTGRLSFGQAAYLGMGGYAATLLYLNTDINFFICGIIGFLAGGLWALLAALIANRLSGIYFAIMTIVVAQLTYSITYEWVGLTKGAMGLQLTPPAILQGGLNYYLFTLAIVIPAIVAFWYLVHSPFGRTLQSIRENPERTAYLGINIMKYYHIVFIIAGLYASLSGVLWAPFNRTMTPGYCGMMKSADSVLMVLLGGAYTFAGPVVGAAIWTLVEIFLGGITEYWWLFMGITVILIILFMKGGVWGTLEEKFKASRWGLAKKVLPTKEDTP